MANGPIETSGNHRLLNNVKGNAIARKRRDVMGKVDEMQSGSKMPKKKKSKKNPYKPGTALHRRWARENS